MNGGDFWHPRNYFHYTGIGTTGRKFGCFTDINWKVSEDCFNENEAESFCSEFVCAATSTGGYLDTAFSTQNPQFRSYLLASSHFHSSTTISSLFEKAAESLTRLPFRAILGISGGADSSLTAEILCRALRTRYNLGFQLPTDQIVLVSFSGRAFNATDSAQGCEFADYLKNRYPDLPIRLVRSELEIDDFRSVLNDVSPVVPPSEITSNLFIPHDFHKAGVLNQAAEAFNFLNVDTTNLTEVALGEATDDTGGYGHISLASGLPKSMIYQLLNFLGIPENFGRASIDTCTHQNKMHQYLDGDNDGHVSTESFFRAIDKVILMLALDFPLGRIVEETMHAERFAHHVAQRMCLTLSREKMGGYPISDFWQDHYSADIRNYRNQFYNIAGLKAVFRL